MLPPSSHERPKGSTPLALILQLLVSVAVVLCEPTAAFQPSSPLSPFATTSSSLQQRGRSRGNVVCKKGGSSSSGPPASKGFGFGAKPKADKYKYSGRLKPGVLSPIREVPEEIMRPDYALDGYVPRVHDCVCAYACEYVSLLIARVGELGCDDAESLMRDLTSSLSLEGGSLLSSSFPSPVPLFSLPFSSFIHVLQHKPMFFQTLF